MEGVCSMHVEQRNMKASYFLVAIVVELFSIKLLIFVLMFDLRPIPDGPVSFPELSTYRTKWKQSMTAAGTCQYFRWWHLVMMFHILQAAETLAWARRWVKL